MRYSISVAVLFSGFAVILPALASPFAPDVKLKEDPVPSQAQVDKLRSAPDSYKFHFGAGRLYEYKGQYNQARDEYEKAIKSPSCEPSSFKRLALTLLLLRDYGKAIEVITEGSKRFPDSYDMQLAAGYVLQAADKDAPAYISYQRALILKPKDVQSYIALADVCIELDHKEKALEYVNRGITVAPSQMMHYERARVLCWLDRKEEAEADLAANYKSDPLNQDNLALYSDVLLNNRHSDKALALEVYLCMVSGLDYRETAKAKYQIGMMIRSIEPKSVAAAEQNALKKVNETHKQAIVHDVLGDVYLRLNRPQEAEKEYNLAAKLDDKSCVIALHLAELSASKGNMAQAREYLSRAQKLDDKNYREITMRIKELARRLKF